MDLLDRLAEDPAHTALFLDIDGVLAPIVPRPEDAHVPEGTRHELRRLARSYALVACVTGRDRENAREIVGVGELTYVGNHGLELETAAAEWGQRLRAFLETVEWDDLEDKQVTASLHYRNAVDQSQARAELEAIAERARAAGFHARFGRKVLELLPPLETNKGTAVRRLLGEHGLRRALYAGDDTTDLDGFGALEGLELAVRVAVASPEGPAELRTSADIVLGDASEVVDLLRRL